MTAAMKWKKVSALTGLALTGQAGKVRGYVIVSAGPGRVKRYAFRQRKGDGHILYRWGRLTGATASYDGERLVSVVFDTNSPVSA